MTRAGKSSHRKRGAFALILAMIFTVVFSALAVSMVTLSGTNVQLAGNHHKANQARACAESGFETIRFWLSHVSIPGATSPSQRFHEIANALQGELTANGITNVTTSHSSSIISIPSVTLDSASASSFSAAITPLGTDALQIGHIKRRCLHRIAERRGLCRRSGHHGCHRDQRQSDR